MLTGIDHIEIVVPDLDAYVEFFVDMGFEIVRRTTHHGGSAEVKLPGDGQTLFELHAVEDQENPGINHIAFRCTNVNDAYDAMSRRGIRFDRAPFFYEETGRRLANFRDPAGFRFQLVEEAD